MDIKQLEHRNAVDRDFLAKMGQPAATSDPTGIRGASAGAVVPKAPPAGAGGASNVVGPGAPSVDVGGSGPAAPASTDAEAVNITNVSGQSHTADGPKSENTVSSAAPNSEKTQRAQSVNYLDEYDSMFGDGVPGEKKAVQFKMTFEAVIT